jgi:hypothetical protein
LSEASTSIKFPTILESADMARVSDDGEF